MKLTLGRKLGLGFGAILFLMVLTGVVSYLKVIEIRQVQDRALTLRVPTILAAKNLQRDVNLATSALREAMLAGTQAGRRQQTMAHFDVAWTAIGQDIAAQTELAPRWTVQANRDKLTRIKEQLPMLHEIQSGAINIGNSSVPDAVAKAEKEYMDKGVAVGQEIVDVVGSMTDSQTKLLNTDRDLLSQANVTQVWTIVVTNLAALGAGIFVATFLGRRISGATSSVLAQAEAIAGGDLTQAEVKLTSKDELGDLTTAINKMQNKLRSIIVSISSNAQQVAAASEEFSATSQQISANSEETSAQANVVSAATEQVNRNLQTVATATEEMSASISEIAKDASEAAKVAGDALKAAVETNATVTKLGESSAEIGQVIKVITSIAQQTNLLALNATIEAARAGEAGKGFAVVANEVKELAKQTAKATEDISLKIGTIQTDAKSAVEAIATISGIIGRVNDISSTIAIAVEEQSATTSEMSRNVSEAAKGSGEVAKNITGVAQAAQSTSSGATESKKAAHDLAQMSTKLRELVGQFRVDSNGHAKQPSA
jgi:methyl-accepting chemotaxis protein